jgi:hypothetical protein
VSALSGAIDSFEHLLLEQDGAETRVEGTNTLVLEDLAETADQTVGELGVRDETDAGGLERAESDISDELSAGGGTEVNGGAVVGGSLVAESVDGLLLEELVSTELEGTLEEVTGGGGTETSPDGASTLVGDDLAEATDQTGVVGDGVKLDTGLDAGWLLARARTSLRRKSCRAAIGAHHCHWETGTYTSTGVRAP